MFRAVVMHQYRDACDELLIDIEEGMFNQKLQLQRGVIFRHEFGREPLASASQTPLRRSVSVYVDGSVILDEEDPW